MTKTILLALSTAVTAAAAGSAFAHATFTESTVTADTYVVMSLQVPHGCDGEATTEVRMELPEGFVFAKPQPKPGWELEIIEGEYKNSYDNHGTAVTSGPVQIRWKGGELPDEYYDTFVVRGKISGVADGTVLAFPATQMCGTDASVAWTEIAAPGINPHSLESPAPTVTVVAQQASGHESMHAHDAAAAPSRLGNLELDGAYVRAMLPGQPVGGGFVTIKNTGSEDDRLISVSSPAAGAVELHEMAMQGEVMRMRKLDDGIPVPAGETVELKSGGLHMMFMQVKKPFKEGDTVPVTLMFEKAGSIDMTLPVKGAVAGGHTHN
ncbi:MAG TPA: copper chaperone PCu(A)C [Pseudorhizobium sp.]|nr:copper chaperone PCu(A)C [Pseudorhizobium sp.]